MNGHEDLLARCGGDLREFERCCVAQNLRITTGPLKDDDEDDDGEITLERIADLPVLN